jgi:hypothetical protein
MGAGSIGVEVARTKRAKAHQQSKQSAQLPCRRMRHCSDSGQRIDLAGAFCFAGRCKARDIRRPATNLRHDVGLPTLSIEDEAGGCSVRKKMTLAVGQSPFSGADAPTTRYDDPFRSE